MEKRRERTTVLRKAAASHIAKMYGIFVTVASVAFFIFFAVVLELWAYDLALDYGRKYGEEYDIIYNIDMLTYGLLAITSLVLTVGGIGLIRSERWAPDTVWICGLVFVVTLWVFFIISNCLWINLTPEAERTLNKLTPKFAISLIGSLFFIIPPLLPPIRNPLRRVA